MSSRKDRNVDLKKVESQPRGGNTTALAAVALQDHLVKSLGLGNVIGPRHVGLGPAARAKQKKEIRSTIDTGRNRIPKAVKKKEVEEEYVLDARPPPMTLAQKMGLVEAPQQLLTESEWKVAKQKSNRREDSKQPCVICKEDFGTQQQVLLSCTHVFHRACLEAFERFTGRKTCPMCRKEQYQTRVIHEGSRQYRHKCATMIQSHWRGYVVRCWYKKLRESVPPKDPKLRQKFYEDKLSSITDRIVRSCDFNVGDFLRDIDKNLEASRNIFRNFDAMFHEMSEEEWEKIQLKAVERGNTDCPICLTSLLSTSYIQKSHSDVQAGHTQPVAEKRNPRSGKQKKPDLKPLLRTTDMCNNCHEEKENQSKSRNRQTVLLSCSHVFHQTCLEMFEELSVGETKHLCPVCRAVYQKKVIPS